MMTATVGDMTRVATTVAGYDLDGPTPRDTVPLQRSAPPDIGPVGGGRALPPLAETLDPTDSAADADGSASGDANAMPKWLWVAAIGIGVGFALLIWRLLG